MFFPRLAISADEGRKWAVVIGVNEYLDPTIPTLKYCVADARRVFETLTKHGGFEPERVLLIADDQTRAHLRPLRLNLQSQIGDWLEHCRPEDTVVVTFSGHGFVDPDTGEGFLAPADCEKDNLRGTSFPTERLRQMLRDCQARQKLLILDCCHAGAVRSGEPTGATSEELSQVFTKAQGLITLASSRKDEVSHEWAAKQQGLFTYFLVEGLAGAADYDRAGHRGRLRLVAGGHCAASAGHVAGGRIHGAGGRCRRPSCSIAIPRARVRRCWLLAVPTRRVVPNWQ